METDGEIDRKRVEVSIQIGGSWKGQEPIPEGDGTKPPEGDVAPEEDGTNPVKVGLDRTGDRARSPPSRLCDALFHHVTMGRHLQHTAAAKPASPRPPRPHSRPSFPPRQCIHPTSHTQSSAHLSHRPRHHRHHPETPPPCASALPIDLWVLPTLISTIIETHNVIHMDDIVRLYDRGDEGYGTCPRPI